MKKIIVCFILLATIFTCCVAFAQTETVNEYVQSFDNVKNAVSLSCGDNLIVAIQPSGIVSKSVFQQRKREIEEGILQNFPQYGEVHVTSSAKVFALIENFEQLDQEKQEKILHHLFKRFGCDGVNRQPVPRPYPIQPLPNKDLDKPIPQRDLDKTTGTII
ncbi:MAG: YhcN/YlaJ family sporulation lipoprotein [Clostridia bacterium]|nr:YhcN/YlaJ family sporulation lipoprotein [Clostridia bacterium]